MLRSLDVNNFQCHTNLHLDLDQITVLCGPNDAGKSATLRALRWVALNEWGGGKDDLVTWGQDVCVVTLTTDKHVITRKKGGGANDYVLDGREFPNFGVVPPPAISSALVLTQDNFQDQAGPAFWLTLNSGQAASALNEIFNLTTIDIVVGSIATNLRQARSKASVSKERLESAQKADAVLTWVEQADEELAVIEGVQKQIEELENEERELSSLLAEIQRAERIQKNAGVVVLLGDKVLEVDAKLDQVIKEMEEIREEIRAEEELALLTKTLNSREATLAKWLAGTCPMCKRG